MTPADATAGTPPSRDPVNRLPPRWTPLAYFGLAHLSLLAATLGLVVWPELLAGTFYHPRLLALVHLVTLGWVTGAVLGALHLVPTMALRSRMTPHKGDGWAFGAFAVGASGVASHFWISEYSGMEGSGVMVLAAASWVAWRALPAIGRGSVSTAVKAHFALAWLNLMLGGGLGVALASDKAAPWIPAPLFAKVFAHAHLLVLGWATMMVMAAGYRLVPMLLPAAIPSGSRVWATALLLEVGVVGLASGLLVVSTPLVMAASLALLAAVAVFLVNVGWMLRHPRPRPKSVPRPDLPAVSVFGSLVALAAAAVLGALLVARGTDASPGLRAAYGVLGLLGFLSQMILGMAQRLLPWLAWLWGYAETGYERTPPVPYAIPSAAAGWWIATCWPIGTLLLVAGAGLGGASAVRVGAVLLTVAAVGSSVQWGRAVRVARGAFVGGR